MSETIRDIQGSIIGYQDRDGTLRDANKKKIGSINLRNGTVRDSHNQEVGFIDGDGNVIDRYRRRVGRIGKDGTVEDWHGIPLYKGSAAPLLLDFEDIPEEANSTARLDFDERARREAGSPSEFERRAREGDASTSRERQLTALMREGFVSPSLLGCLGIVGAVVVGLLILFFFQNPSFLSRAAATPIAPLGVNAPAVGTLETNAASKSDATPTPRPITGKVNADILNLRAGPGTTHAIVDQLKTDTIVILTGRTQDRTWLKVTVPIIGKDGWVAAEYVNTEIDLANLPVAEAPAP